jgi:hypothetical protein
VRPLYEKADKLSSKVIGAAIEVHRHKGPGLILYPSSKAQLFSHMKLLNIPIGLLINFHEPVLKNGISRMILPGANRADQNGSKDSVIPTLKTFVLFVSFC